MKAPTTQQRLIEQAGSAPNDEPLAPPSLAAQTEMARHLGKEHRYPDFRLGRDVYLGGGERRPSQLLTWDPGQARFWCARCPGMVFGTGEVTDAMVVHAQLFDEGLRGHLTGLLTPEARDKMTRLYLSGKLNSEHLRRLQAAGPRRRAATGKRPVVDHRREKVQKWILERLRERGVLERVYEEAEAMQREDPDAWLRIAFRPLGREALRKYAQDIDQEEKDKARAEFARRQIHARRS